MQDQAIAIKPFSEDFHEAARDFANRFIDYSTSPAEVATMRRAHGEEGIKEALRQAEPHKISFAMRPDKLIDLGFTPSECAYR